MDARPQSGPPGRFGWSELSKLAAAVAVGLIVPALLYLLARPLALLVLAFTFAAALSPPADFLERRMPRPLAVVLLYLVVVATVATLLGSVVPTFASETRGFIDRAPALLDQAQRWLAGVLPVNSVPLRDGLKAALLNAQDTWMTVPMFALGVLFDLLVVLFLSLYLLISGPKLKAFILSLVPRRSRRRSSRLLARVGRAMGGYVRGAVLSGVFVGALVWIALWIVGLEYRQSLAVAAGFGEFVPYIGPLLAAMPAVLLGLSESPSQGLLVGGIYLGLQQVESYVITPNVMKTQTDLPPALVIFALACGFAAGGLVGALAALPLFAAGRVLLLAAAPLLRHRLARQSSGASASRLRRSS